VGGSAAIFRCSNPKKKIHAAAGDGEQLGKRFNAIFVLALFQQHLYTLMNDFFRSADAA